MASVQHVVDVVFDSLILRKVYHLVGGLVVTALIIVVDNGVLLFVLGMLYVVCFRLVGGRISFAVLAVLLLAAITRSRFVCAGAMLVLTIGDGAAAVVGRSIGGVTWPWNQSKTVAGTTAFFVSALVALLIYVPLATAAPPASVLWLAMLPAAAGALVESVPIRVIRDRKPDDNLVIVMTVGLTLYTLAAALSAPVTL